MNSVAAGSPVVSTLTGLALLRQAFEDSNAELFGEDEHLDVFFTTNPQWLESQGIAKFVHCTRLPSFPEIEAYWEAELGPRFVNQYARLAPFFHAEGHTVKLCIKWGHTAMVEQMARSMGIIII